MAHKTNESSQSNAVLTPDAPSSAESTAQTSPGGGPSAAGDKSRLLLRLLVLALVAVLVVIAFFLGRSTAPGSKDTGATATYVSGGKDAAKNPHSKALADFIGQTGLVPGTDFAPATSGAESTAALQSLMSVTDSPERTLGAKDAKVKITVIEDFSCPMCTKWQKETFPQLKPLIDAGQVALQWHNLVIFPNMGSDLAAHGAVAAAKQNKLWDFIQTAYGSAKDGDHPEYNPQVVKDLAQQAGVPDLAKFAADMADPKTVQEVEGESNAARQVGINGTPFFVIGTSVISGAYPAEYFLNTVKFQQFLAEHS